MYRVSSLILKRNSVAVNFIFIFLLYLSRVNLVIQDDVTCNSWYTGDTISESCDILICKLFIHYEQMYVHKAMFAMSIILISVLEN